MQKGFECLTPRFLKTKNSTKKKLVSAVFVTFLCLHIQDSTDTGGFDQCERRQSEQPPRGSHGQDHICQCQQGKAAFKILLKLTLII